MLVSIRRNWIPAFAGMTFWMMGVASGQELTAEQDSRYRSLVNELRCLVCQNQSISDSNAPLAEDLRQQVKTQILAGRSDREIQSYMTERYGEFVLYRPRMSTRTVALWAAPALLVLTGLALLWRLLRRRTSAPAPTPMPDEAALRKLLDQDKRAS